MGIVRKLLEKNWEQCGVNDQKRIDSQTEPSGLTQILDIPYIDDGTREHLLDIYYPESTASPLPVIIDIHGGGWMYGYKEINKNFCLKLAEKGFLVASINYRLVSRECWFDDQISDIFAALKWLGVNLKSYPADTDNVFLAGDSAGGHFACLAAAVNEDKAMREDFCVSSTGLHFNAVCAICPATNLSDRSPLSWAMRPILLGRNHRKSIYKKYMDIGSVVSDKLPPFYIVTASGDFLRKYSYYLEELLKKQGVEYKLHDFDGLLDGKKLGHVFNVSNPFSVYGDRANTEMAEFFKERIVEKV